MNFVSVPRETISQINKAGRVLRASPKDVWALNLADRWRACHAYPIHTFYSTLKIRLKKYASDSIAAQRLKRMPTIIDKLKREHTMALALMQDIGGVRAVVNTVNSVRELEKLYLDKEKFEHELVIHKDYIGHPKTDGYRGVHLIYRYKNKRAKAYNGLLLELQLRTRLQHNWATAVETMSTFLGQRLKFRQGEAPWRKFFVATSAAFAHLEKCNPPPGYENISKEETFAMVTKLDRELKALEQMQGIAVVTKNIHTGGSRAGSSYHLIILNSVDKQVTVQSYSRTQIQQANRDYIAYEKKAANGEPIEPVLVSAGNLMELKKAYPSFFLDVRPFVGAVTTIKSQSSV